MFFGIVILDFFFFGGYIFIYGSLSINFRLGMVGYIFN